MSPSTLLQDLETLKKAQLETSAYTVALSRIIKDEFQNQDELALLELKATTISGDAIYALLSSRDKKFEHFGWEILEHYKNLDNQVSNNTLKMIPFSLIKRCLEKNPFSEHTEKAGQQKNSDTPDNKPTEYQKLLRILISSCEGYETPSNILAKAYRSGDSILKIEVLDLCRGNEHNNGTIMSGLCNPKTVIRQKALEACHGNSRWIEPLSILVNNHSIDHFGTEEELINFFQSVGGVNQPWDIMARFLKKGGDKTFRWIKENYQQNLTISDLCKGSSCEHPYIRQFVVYTVSTNKDIDSKTKDILAILKHFQNNKIKITKEEYEEYKNLASETLPLANISADDKQAWIKSVKISRLGKIFHRKKPTYMLIELAKSYLASSPLEKPKTHS